MIFIKNGENFERANDWTEIQSRNNYYPRLELREQQLADVFGYYEDLPQEIPCGKANCRKGHKKGFLVVTNEGFETNVGHVCGTNVFGLAFETLAVDLENKANFHRYLTALRNAKKNLFIHYQTKARLESSKPSLEWIANRILDMKDPKIIGRATYQALKKMAGSGDGRIIISKRKSRKEADLQDVMSQYPSSNADVIEGEEGAYSSTPAFKDELIGVVRYPESLLNDYDVALIFERDIRLVLEELQRCNPDEMPEKKVMSFGIRVFRLEERFRFLEERLEKARLFVTYDNLKPLSKMLSQQKSVSNKDKLLFKKFLETLL